MLDTRLCFARIISILCGWGSDSPCMCWLLARCVNCLVHCVQSTRCTHLLPQLPQQPLPSMQLFALMHSTASFPATFVADPFLLLFHHDVWDLSFQLTESSLSFVLSAENT